MSDLTARSFGHGDYQQLYELTRAAYDGCPFMPKQMGWLVEVRGQVVGKLQLLDQVIQIGRSWVSAVGGHGLVVEPEHRGRGYPRMLSQPALDAARDAGFPFYFGFARAARFWRRLGGGAVLTAEYELTIEAPAPGDANHGFRELSPGDLQELLRLYHRDNAGRTGILKRTAERWPWLYRRPPLFLIRPDGYLGLQVSSDELVLLEIAGESASFCERALSCLGRLAADAGARRITAHVPADHPFAVHAQRRGARLRVMQQGSCVGLILDLQSLIEAIAEELEARLAASGLGSHRVRLAFTGTGAQAEVTLGLAGASEHVLELTVPHHVIAQLVFGHRSVREALPEHGVALSEDSMRLLEVLLPEGHPYVWTADRF